MNNQRLDDIKNFYSILNEIELQDHERRLIADSDARMTWPQRGVYFITEAGEDRSESGEGPRIIRVGTHAITTGSGVTLWQRLRQHRGTKKKEQGTTEARFSDC